MRDPNDSRNIRPRIGSPLWIYLTAVTTVGVGALALALLQLSQAGLPRLLSESLVWMIAALSLAGELRPLITPGRSAPDSPAVSLAFWFAALLYWGFGAAALLVWVTTLAAAAAGRQAVFRAAFNAAQYTLAVGAAAFTLAAAGIHPQPLAPWVPHGGHLPTVALAAAAYFAVNFTLVIVAVAIHTRAPIVAAARKALPYQAFVNLVLLSAAPLVVVVMARSVLLVLLFLVPLTAIYANASLSLRREHLAHHDGLTGLPNRSLLMRQTADALANAAWAGGRVGFLLLDLDRFKEVNDTLGHPVGDALLRVVAARLARSVRPGDMVARLGGDEFAILLPSVRDPNTAREVALRLRAALAEPVRLEGLSFEVEASVGIALYPDSATAVEVLLQHADVAMYLAKEHRTGVETYAHDIDHNSPARLSLLGDLRRGIDRGELELHYQPKVLLADGRTAGMEALVRWRHPMRGMIMPAEFLPVAEQSHLMRDLTAYVLEGALAQAAQWRQEGMRVPVSVNLSARDLLDPGLAETVQQALSRHGLPPAELILEINERLLAGDSAPTLATMAGLAAVGVALSLDNFGTGYSSLAHLTRTAVSEIKIDSSFITRLLDTPDNEVVVRSLVELGNELAIATVAEGVETPGVAAALRGMGCPQAQGRYFAGPMDPAAATEWLGGRLPPGESVPERAARARRTGQRGRDRGEPSVPPHVPFTGSAGRSV